ncbi:ankyrin [Apiospora marii]|uniref:Ankyrin n=1 Tax=Apiospora marii TaxID=335849 RepID=A0ABR1RCU2_9PEZI
MHFLDFPPEIMDEIFDEFVRSRDPRRMVRLRLVNTTFRYFIDYSVFRHRYLKHILRSANLPAYYMAIEHNSPENPFEPWVDYCYRYLECQAQRKRFDEDLHPCLLTRVHLAAQALCHFDGERPSDKGAVLHHLRPLLQLAATFNTRRLITRIGPCQSFEEHELVQRMWYSLEQALEKSLEDDLFVAAVFRGHKAYVKYRLEWLTHLHGPQVFKDSYVFGHPLRVAVRKGDLGMLLLLYSYMDQQTTPPQHLAKTILPDACVYKHREMFD